MLITLEIPSLLENEVNLMMIFVMGSLEKLNNVVRSQNWPGSRNIAKLHMKIWPFSGAYGVIRIFLGVNMISLNTGLSL